MSKLIFLAGLFLVLIAGCGRSNESGRENAARDQERPRGRSEMGPGMMGGMGRGMMGNSENPASGTGAAIPGGVAENDKGIGPVTNLELGPIDPALAKKGETLFISECASCHALDKRRMGPALGDIARERTPEFIMNMIMNPQGMEQKDPIARELRSEYNISMPALGLERDQARAILEYLRATAESNK